MNQSELDPRYPIGRFVKPNPFTEDDRHGAIATLAELPEMLRNAVDGLDTAQLSTPYREGGWTVRTGGASRGGQPYERSCPVEAGPDRGLADDQTV